MPLKHGHARVEFLALKQEAEAMLAKGHSCAEVFAHFRDAGKISMSYRSFMYHARALRKVARRLEQKTKAGASPGTSEKTPDVPAKKPDASPANEAQDSRPILRIGGNRRPKFTDNSGYDGIGIVTEQGSTEK